MPTENQALAIGFLFYVAAAVFAGPCLVACSASLVTVVNQTATGQDDVDDWPGMVSTEWMGTAPYFVVAAMGGAVPLIAWLPLAGGVLPQWLVWYGAVYLSTAVASMVLLSTLGSGSPLLVLSTTVLGSLTLRSRCWFKFLLFLVFWAIGMAAGIYLVQTNRMDGILLGAPLLMLASFLYARTVGVLGYQLSRYRDGDLLDRLHDSMDPEVVD